jgi:hypothetical protein
MLGGALQLGERGDVLTALAGQGVVDLEKQGLVGLDDERTVGHRMNPRRCWKKSEECRRVRGLLP